MKQIKIRNHFNARFAVKPGEINTKPSKTIPDQTLTIRELMNRYAKGLPLGPDGKNAYYDSDQDEPSVDLAHMDLVDRQEYLEAKFGHLQKSLTDAKLAKEKQELDMAIEAEIKKRGLVSGSSGAPLGG